MKNIKIIAAVFISLISIFAVSISVSAHHSGRYYNAGKSINYCICADNYIDADNNGICDNCNYVCTDNSNYRRHGHCCH